MHTAEISRFVFVAACDAMLGFLQRLLQAAGRS
jgi:hypothetical protein